MIIRKHSEHYNFTGDTETGITMHWGKTFKDDPVFAPWPELADISIGNKCTKGCSFCYKNSTPDADNMTLEQYEFVLESLQSKRWGNVFQVALGGGEPLEHEQFVEIIEATHRRNIVANFTTNGDHINRDIVKRLQGKVGALAVSTRHFDDIDKHKIDLLNQAGIKTNLHFILSDSSVEEATEMLKGRFDKQPSGINNVAFLSYKQAGSASEKNLL